MIAADFTLWNTLDFWDHAGRALGVAALVYGMIVVSLAMSGHVPTTWPLRRKTTRGAGGSRSGDSDAGDVDKTVDKTVVASRTAGTTRASSSEQHREVLDRLNTALRYQGSTVALIIFAVSILGLVGVVSGAEVATILSGIAGYVLGTGKSQGGPDPVANGAHTGPVVAVPPVGHDAGGAAPHEVKPKAAPKKPA